MWAPYLARLSLRAAVKSMIAYHLSTILPMMSLAEPIEATHIHSTAAQTGAHSVFVTTRPHGLPRHTIVCLVAGSWLQSRTLSRTAVAYY